MANKGGADANLKLIVHRENLQLARTWTTARGSVNVFPVVIIELRAGNRAIGLGEAAPVKRYQESVDSVEAFCGKVDSAKLSFEDVSSSMKYLDALAPGNAAAKCALNVALLDGAAKGARKSLHQFLGLRFREHQYVTSFSIGINTPDVIRQEVLAADNYPVLKLKFGSPNDRMNFRSFREAAPYKAVRVDANEAWQSKEAALQMIEWLAEDRYVQFVEQPMPANSNPRDLLWLKERSPLPLLADEAYRSAEDVAHCLRHYHGVNVKLVKAGGVNAGLNALRAARNAGLKTMIGCMIESSVLISAAAHLAEMCDYFDLDGNLLIKNDPYRGVTADGGVLSFADAAEEFGLRVSTRT